MRIADLRHLDAIKGAFGIHDGIEYRASANVKKGGQLLLNLLQAMLRR
jgi:hypothetical protein